MVRDRLLRVASYAAVGSAFLGVVALVGFVVVVGSGTISEGAESPSFFVPTGAALGAIVLLGIALVGLFLYQEESLGPTGVAAFLVALVGTFLAAGGQWTYVFVVPHFAESVPELINEGSGTVVAGFVLSYAVLAVGWIWFGTETLKTGLFPRGAVYTLIGGAAIAFLPLPSRTLVLSVAVAFLGTRLRKSGGNARRELAVASRQLFE